MSGDSPGETHLVHRQVDACVGNDAQHVWDVAFIKRSKAFSPED